MAKAAVLWLHGLGDEGPGWMGAFSRVDRAVEGVKWVHPTAPIQEVTIRGDETTSWFDIRTWPIALKEPEGPRGIDKTVAWVHRELEKLEAQGIPPEKIVLGGFSQGGTVSLLAGLSYKSRLAGIVSISGWAAYRADLAGRVSEANKTVPYLFTCGVGDPVVKHELTKESSRLLESMLGSGLAAIHANRLGHPPSAEEVRATEDFIIRVLSA